MQYPFNATKQLYIYQVEDLKRRCDALLSCVKSLDQEKQLGKPSIAAKQNLKEQTEKIFMQAHTVATLTESVIRPTFSLGLFKSPDSRD